MAKTAVLKNLRISPRDSNSDPALDGERYVCLYTYCIVRYAGEIYEDIIGKI